MASAESWLTIVSVIVTGLVPLFLLLRIKKVSKQVGVSETEEKKIVLWSSVLLFGWYAIVLGLALLDFFHVSAQFLSPLVPAGFILPIIAGITLMRNRVVQKLISLIGQEWLVLLQVFRLLGVIFFVLYLQGLLPALFAIPSGVGDVVVGLTAPLVAYFYLQGVSWKNTAILAWNAFGILDLLVAIGVGVTLALPAPFQLVATSPSTEIMTIYPLVLVPAYAVPLGFVLHLFSLKALYSKK